MADAWEVKIKKVSTECIITKQERDTYREVAGDTTSRADKSDPCGSLTGRVNEQDGLEVVGYGMEG